MCLVTYSWKEPDSMKKVKHFVRNNGVAWANVEVTESCNLNCKWCYAAEKQESEFSGINNADWKKAVEICSNSGIKQITFSGG